MYPSEEGEGRTVDEDGHMSSQAMDFANSRELDGVRQSSYEGSSIEKSMASNLNLAKEDGELAKGEEWILLQKACYISIYTRNV